MHISPPPGTPHPAPLQLRKDRDGSFSSSHSPYSHTPEDVAAAIQYYISPQQYGLTSDQQRALATYNDMRDINAVPDFEDPPKFNKLLREYLGVFDQLFFFGALRGHVTVSGTQHMENAIGLTYPAKQHGGSDIDPRASRAQILILNRHDELYYEHPDQRLDGYLGTLLHEALHAAFMTYVCEHREHEHCKEEKMTSLGEHGHKSSWRETATIIERTTQRLGMLRYPALSLNIPRSVRLR